MKKIVLFLVALVFSLQASTFDTAVEKAMETDKLLLVELVMEFCPYCDRMEESVLSKPDIQKILDEKYVFVKLDIKKDTIPMNMPSRLTPTFYFVSSDGLKVIDELRGLTKKSDFKFYLEEIYAQIKGRSGDN